MEIEFDLTDYSLELDYREQSENLELLQLLETEKSLHPLARFSQPYDWSSSK
jgi:hypothetical protein